MVPFVDLRTHICGSTAPKSREAKMSRQQRKILVGSWFVCFFFNFIYFIHNVWMQKMAERGYKLNHTSANNDAILSISWGSEILFIGLLILLVIAVAWINYWYHRAKGHQEIDPDPKTPKSIPQLELTHARAA